MLSRTSKAPATLLHALELSGCVLLMIAMLTVDGVFSPLITDEIARWVLLISSPWHCLWHFASMLIRLCACAMEIWWHSPWAWKIFFILLMQHALTVWLWAAFRRTSNELLLYLFDGSWGTAGLCAWMTVSTYSEQFNRLLPRMDRVRLSWLGAPPRTEGDLCELGFKASIFFREMRRPFSCREAYLTRAVVFTLLGLHFPSLALDGLRRSLPGDGNLVAEESMDHYASGAPSSRCFSFTGFPIDCGELQRVREFNQATMPRLKSATIASVRKSMNAQGLHGHIWHVGHACPDPSKSSTRNDEDYMVGTYSSFT